MKMIHRTLIAALAAGCSAAMAQEATPDHWIGATSMSRAQVQAELQGARADGSIVATAVQYDFAAQVASLRGRAQVQAETMLATLLAALANLPFSLPEPNLVGWQDVRPVIEGAYEASIAGKTPAAQSAKKLKEEADKLLAEKRQRPRQAASSSSARASSAPRSPTGSRLAAPGSC